MDISKIKSLGWNPKIQLQQGITMMYQWYKECGGGALGEKFPLSACKAKVGIANARFRDFKPAFVLEVCCA